MKRCGAAECDQRPSADLLAAFDGVDPAGIGHVFVGHFGRGERCNVGLNPERFAEFEKREFPWGRLGAAGEIADVVVFMLSERARWINGAHVPVDGAQGRPNAF